MPARQGKIRQKRHHFLFHLIIDIKTKLTTLFLFKQVFNVYNGRDRVFHDFSNLFDSRSQTINKHSGDGGNDIPMLKVAGIGVAMGNASEIVKASANFVTDTVENDGLCKALKHFGII